jgi:hypothetical protein
MLCHLLLISNQEKKLFKVFKRKLSKIVKDHLYVREKAVAIKRIIFENIEVFNFLLFNFHQNTTLIK